MREVATHFVFFNSFSHIPYARAAQPKFYEAKPLFEKCIRIDHMLHGSDNVEVALDKVCNASLFSSPFAEALLVFRRVLDGNHLQTE